jgi:hypothetical protein
LDGGSARRKAATYIQDIGGMDWIDLAEGQQTMEDPCEYGNKPSIFIKCWEVLE